MLNLIRSIACGICRALGGSEADETNPAPDLVYAGEMDIYELSSLLIDKFPDVPIYLPDISYKLCTKTDIERFLAWDKADKEKYQAEILDCDDFAWRLKGNITVLPWSAIPFGAVWTDLHALNIVVLNDKEIYFVEPQTDEIQKELYEWQGKELRFIAM